ncbi:MAG: DMT family transporter [Planctomycetes bacterium]|nr:DMT family transporter [Planctomycetota bacterium]
MAFATLDLIRKFLSRSERPSVVVSYLVGGQILIFGAWVAFDPVAVPGPGYWPPLAVSVVANFIANLLFLEALRRSHLSRTIPFLALSPAFAALAGLVVLHEHLAVRQWLGIALVVAGALALNFESGGLIAAFSALRRESGSLMMVGTAACWGLAAPFDKRALRLTELRMHAFLAACGVGLLLLLMMIKRRRLHALIVAAPALRLLGLAILVAIAALGLQLVAYRAGPVGLAETIKRVIGLTSAVVLGRLVFAEAVTAAKLRGVALMAVGVVLIVV